MLTAPMRLCDRKARYDMAASEPMVVSYSWLDNYARKRWGYLVRPQHSPANQFWANKAANEQLKSLR